MSSISYFAPAFDSSLATERLQTSSQTSSKKRKRDTTTLQDWPHSQDTQLASRRDEPSLSASLAASSAQSFPLLKLGTLSHDAATQYKASGQLIDKDLPSGTFPHTSRQHTLSSKVRRQIEDDLAALKPPLYISARSSDANGSNLCGVSGLRQRHLSIVTAILHRCLLEGDYVRAGRAWGMLLRTENGGHSMDLRSNGRWGLGAEIILQRERQLFRKDQVDEHTSSHQEDYDVDRGPEALFTSEGFEKAKDYYERLGLQYPYRKSFPTAIGPLEFYYAMFGLWIYTVEEQRLRELASIEKVASEAIDGDVSGSESESHGSRRRVVIYRETSRRAREIATRLDELFSSPPYSDSTAFRKIQDMVTLWIDDLSSFYPRRNELGCPEQGGGDRL